MRLAVTAALFAGLAAAPALAGNTSSNSSSNSSNGIHTRVDTVITDDDRGRRSYYERRIYRDERAPRERRRFRSW
ncbi:MAG TPA: hypothetical protein VIU82_05815 [Bosea sp. (in: a-proteobacteria)]